MRIPSTQIIDNDKESLANWLKIFLEEDPKTNLDIATAFFGIEAYTILKDSLEGVKRFRLLLGKSPEIKNDKTLGDALLEIVEDEVEGFDLTKEKHDNVKDLIKFLNKSNVEVKIYEKDFLHGKAYIFDQVIVIGSSNFTAPGLTYNTELNSVSLAAQAKYTREEWFEKFWKDAKDFKSELITLLENSRFGSHEYSPYEVYIKALFELQKDDIKAERELLEMQRRTDLPETKVNLAEFQEDAVQRIFSRLKKYRAVMVADSVGLGKTWIAKRIIEEFGFYRRKRYLVVCPAQLRDIMWRKELKDIILSESIISQEELASEDFIEKAKKATGNHLGEIELIVVDESHNLRNPLSNRWENLFTLINDYIANNNGGRKPYILFMTATPINNTIWDLYWQIMLLVSMDKNAFIKENIPDLFKFFKDIDKTGDPTQLNDLLNEISIRRTRDYIKKNYPDAEIDGKKIIFPDRKLENITYKLDDAYKGMYKEISSIISTKLKMPYYRILKYKKEEKLTQEEEWALNRMIALEGIFRTILLKRLESSVEAFRISINRHIRFLEKLKDYLKKGRLLSKETFNKFFSRYIMMNDEQIDEDFEDLEEGLKESLIEFNIKDYKEDELFEDIENDIKLLKNDILTKVNKIKPDEDAKLIKLKDMVLKLHEKSQIVIFTYYADTLDYIYKNIISSKEFHNLRIAKISGRDLRVHKGKEELELSREKLVEEFTDRKIDILMSTDVLSEGQNLQSAQILINYDLHWNPTRMIQRAGRIDRIGSSYKEIYVFNFFPEDELEELLNLVLILQNKIIDIDKTVGLDQTILGEKIHPKVFGIIRRIKEKDLSIFDELEADAFGGGERFYQPLKDFLKKRAIQELEKIPYGIYSSLQQKKMRGIFFYYKYGTDFHYWYLYDLSNGQILKNKTQILEFISCKYDEPRIIPDFFNEIFNINRKIVDEIEKAYKEIQLKETQDTSMVELTRDRSTKFIKQIIDEIEIQIDTYLLDFNEDKKIEQDWTEIKNRLLETPLTKKRLSVLRKIWKKYKTENNWKALIKEIGTFLQDKGTLQKEKLEPFNKKNLRLVVVDLIS